MKIKFYDIKWDCDDTDVSLPSTVKAIIDDTDFDIESQGADFLSDKYGYCVFGFEYKIIS
jgi:hypothetical protein